MRALVQRVSSAKVVVGEEIVGAIDRGLLVLVGVCEDDQAADAAWLSSKLIKLRIFEDAAGKLNLSIADLRRAQQPCGLLAVSQFTLCADTRGGNRPSFTNAMRPEPAQALFLELIEHLRTHGPVETGRFQTHMAVHLVNDGPVTIWLDSRERA